MDASDSAIGRFLGVFAAARADAFFVQVGSNDGEHNDPLRPFINGRRWRGVMIEPVPYVFARLRQNYQDHHGVILVNAAITSYDGFSPFYCLAESPDALPEWYDQLGSFALEPILDDWIMRVIPDIRDRIVTITVPCMTFETLCGNYGVERVDLLHIDAEGHDFEIIKTIDLERWRPTIVLYEHKHLSGPDRDMCRGLLSQSGYATVEFANDTLCVTRASVSAPASRLAEAWRVAGASAAGLLTGKLNPADRVPREAREDRPAGQA